MINIQSSQTRQVHILNQKCHVANVPILSNVQYIIIHETWASEVCNYQAIDLIKSQYVITCFKQNFIS